MFVLTVTIAWLLPWSFHTEMIILCLGGGVHKTFTVMHVVRIHGFIYVEMVTWLYYVVGISSEELYFGANFLNHATKYNFVEKMISVSELQ